MTITHLITGRPVVLGDTTVPGRDRSVGVAGSNGPHRREVIAQARDILLAILDDTGDLAGRHHRSVIGRFGSRGFICRLLFAFGLRFTALLFSLSRRARRSFQASSLPGLGGSLFGSFARFAFYFGNSAFLGLSPGRLFRSGLLGRLAFGFGGSALLGSPPGRFFRGSLLGRFAFGLGSRALLGFPPGGFFRRRPARPLRVRFGSRALLGSPLGGFFRGGLLGRFAFGLGSRPLVVRLKAIAHCRITGAVGHL